AFALLRQTLRLPRIPPDVAALADPIALAAALLWEVHPLTSETVSYTSTRTEGLMALFFVLTLYCAVRAMRSGRPVPWQAAAVAACAIGMGCKEVTAVAP